MLLKEINYKSYIIVIDVSKETGLFSSYVSGISGESSYWSLPTILEAENLAKASIDKFLLTTPKNYKELTALLTDAIMLDDINWHSDHKEASLDEDSVKILVENFIKFINNK